MIDTHLCKTSYMPSRHTFKHAMHKLDTYWNTCIDEEVAIMARYPDLIVYHHQRLDNDELNELINIINHHERECINAYSCK